MNTLHKFTTKVIVDASGPVMLTMDMEHHALSLGAGARRQAAV